MTRAIIQGVVIASVLLGAGTSARATEVASGRDFGLGVAVGGPTSIVGKYFLSNRDAFDFGVSFGNWGYRCRDRFDRWCDGYRRDVGFNVDYLLQDSLARGSANLDWHIGGGARLWVWDDGVDDDLALAARMPVGLDLTFSRPSFLEVFLELAPALYLVPVVTMDIEGFVGVRFYF